MLDGYIAGPLRPSCCIFYTRFINTMKQEPVMRAAAAAPSEPTRPARRAPNRAGSWDYIYEPDARERARRRC